MSTRIDRSSGWDLVTSEQHQHYHQWRCASATTTTPPAPSLSSVRASGFRYRYERERATRSWSEERAVQVGHATGGSEEKASERHGVRRSMGENSEAD